MTDATDAAEAADGPALNSLEGARSPQELAEALLGFFKLPAKGQQGFGELLVPHLDAMPEDQVDARLVRLCRRAELDPVLVAPPVKAARFLFRKAAAANVSAQGFADDLNALCRDAASRDSELGSGSDLAASLVPLYTQALPALRRELIVRALRSHGRVFAGMEWRVDTIGSSNDGRDLAVPVAWVTLHYHDGDDLKRFTLQLLPDMVNQMRTICDDLLAR